MAINEDEGDLDTAPVALAKTLMPVRKGDINCFRDPPKETPSEDVTARPSKNLPPSPYMQYPYTYFPYGAPSQYPQLPPYPPHPQ